MAADLTTTPTYQTPIPASNLQKEAFRELLTNGWRNPIPLTVSTFCNKLITKPTINITKAASSTLGFARAAGLKPEPGESDIVIWKALLTLRAHEVSVFDAFAAGTPSAPTIKDDKKNALRSAPYDKMGDLGSIMMSFVALYNWVEKRHFKQVPPYNRPQIAYTRRTGSNLSHTLTRLGKLPLDVFEAFQTTAEVSDEWRELYDYKAVKKYTKPDGSCYNESWYYDIFGSVSDLPNKMVDKLTTAPRLTPKGDITTLLELCTAWSAIKMMQTAGEYKTERDALKQAGKPVPAGIPTELKYMWDVTTGDPTSAKSQVQELVAGSFNAVKWSSSASSSSMLTQVSTELDSQIEREKWWWDNEEDKCEKIHRITEAAFTALTIYGESIDPLIHVTNYIIGTQPIQNAVTNR